MPSARGAATARCRRLADLGAHGVELGEEGELEGLLQEGGARRSAGARLHADGALHRLQVPEPPELEVLLEVDELLAGLVGRPVVVGVLVDGADDADERLVEDPGLGDVAVEDVLRNGVPGAGEVAQELVVDAGRLEQFGEQGVSRGIRLEHAQHAAVLVAEHELDRAVLVRLEAARVAEEAAELGVLGRRQGGQHRPLLGEGALDVLDPGDALEGLRQLVGAQQVAGAGELVQHELQPELGGLVLDDEQQLVVVLGRAHGVLGTQQGLEVEVAAVAHPLPEVGDDARVELARVLLDRQRMPPSTWASSLTSCPLGEARVRARGRTPSGVAAASTRFERGLRPGLTGRR